MAEVNITGVKTKKS